MSIRVLHTADWHIGSFSGPEINGENGRFLDVKNILAELIEKAKMVTPDIIIVAGDLFHQAKVWSDRGLKEQALCVNTLRELAKIAPVVAMRGTANHDSEEQFATMKQALKHEDSITIVTEPCMDFYTTKTGQIVQIACLPGFDKNVYHVKNTSEDTDGIFYTKLLNNQILDFGMKKNTNVPTILVGHQTIAGANMESGQTALFADSEPVITQDSIIAAQFTLTCFGHIHKHQMFTAPINASYCGSLMQLNFNDEGQERGFYIHDIDLGANPVTTFMALSGRQHKTITLTDAQVQSINEGTLDLSKYPDIKGKIVRIQYSCSEVNNKQFNHANVQNNLRTAGAYYVAEISPIKITMSLNGLAMDRLNTPEDNLEDYLLQKKKPQDEVQRLLQLAAPMFDTVNATKKKGKHNGRLLPKTISVKNYRNYVNETFDFEHIQFCTINGDNGVGKSSLFMDAICDALYEEPRENELTGWIRNDPKAKTGTIEFTFALGDETFRVTRKRAKSGKINLSLEQFMPDDNTWVNRSHTKTKDTQTAIEELIGMDSLTFRACALIMQDQYGLFLEADKEVRMDILGNILGLSVYEMMEKNTADNITNLNRSIRDLKTQIDTITNGVEDIDILNGEINNNRNSANELNKQLSTIQQKWSVLVAQEQEKITALKNIEQTRQWVTEKLTDYQKQKEMLQKQLQISQDADELIKQEKDIQEGLTEYQKLQEQFNKAQATQAANNIKKSRITQIINEIATANLEKETLTKRIETYTTQLSEIQMLLKSANELEESHIRYTNIIDLINKTNKNLTEIRKDFNQAEKDYQIYAQKVTTINHNKQVTEQAIETIKKRISLMNNCNCLDIEKANCAFLTDAKQASKELPVKQNELEDIENQIIQVNQQLNILENNRNSIEQQIHELENILKEQTNEMNQLKLSEQNYQNMLIQKERAVNIQEMLQQTKITSETLDNRISSLTTEKDTIESENNFEIFDIAFANIKAAVDEKVIFVELSNKLSMAKQAKSQADQMIILLNDKISEIDKNITDLRNKIQEYQVQADGLNDIQIEIRELKQQTDEINELSLKIAMTIGQLETRKANSEKRMQEAAAIVNNLHTLQATLVDYETLKQAFSIDGIRHNIIRSIIPVLEASSTAILSQMSGGRMTVEFKTEKTLKSNKNKEITTLDIIVHDSITGSLPYASRSGGEKVKVSLSVILALAEIRSRNSGISIGFLFIDEPPFLDTTGGQAYCDALMTVQSRYPDLKIMAITHDISMKSRFPQNVTVIKTQNGSKIERI